MAQSEAPHTRGFLFADLRGYTQFVEKHGDDAASQLLSAYRTLVRTAVAQSTGAEIRTEGDGFYVVFPSASSAIRCALAILVQAAQSTAAAGGALPVGIGIHAGETADSAEGFVGSAVNIAARVCALAGPGELLITETVRGLVRTSMRLAIDPRGRRHLKGIREPIGLFALRPEGAAPRSRSQRFRSVTGRSLERRPILAAFAALAGVAAVATIALAVGLLANTNAHPGVGRLTASSGANPSAAAPEDGAFPNATERALLARLDPGIARLCRRAARDDSPRVDLSSYTTVDGKFVMIPGTHRSEPLPVDVGVQCRPDEPAPDSIFIWTLRPNTGVDRTVDAYLSGRAARANVPAGDCASDDRAYMHWSYGLTSGNALCTTTAASARIEWTFEDQDLIVSAERDDGDRAALYRWWLQEGRSILH
jgi:class 3 adenylate cyclase